MSQLTQNLNESTQICDEDDDMNDNDDNGIHGLSSLTPLNPLDVPWARLVPYHGGGGNSGATYDDNNNNDDNINNNNNNNNNNINNNSGRNTVSSDPIDLLPRDPIRHIGSATRSRSIINNEYTAADNSNNGIISFLGLHDLRASDRFNEYVIGRSKRCGVVVPRICHSNSSHDDNKDTRQYYDGIHAMVSNRHCAIFCILDHQSSHSNPTNNQHHKNSSGMEVYVEDQSGNGTFINNNILLRKGERRLLHTGDTICLLNPAALKNSKTMRSFVSSRERTRVLEHYSFVFINVHQTVYRGMTRQLQESGGMTTRRGTQYQSQSQSKSQDQTQNQSHLNIRQRLMFSPVKVKGITSTTIAPVLITAAVVDVRAAIIQNDNNSKITMPPPPITVQTPPKSSSLLSLPPPRPLSNKKKRPQSQSPSSSHEQTQKQCEKEHSQQKNRNKIEPQRRVEEHYDIRDLLGSGTCGEVRRAIHRRTGEMVAVKIIATGKRSFGNDSNDYDPNVLAEVEILRSLNHPYIVKLLDVFPSTRSDKKSSVVIVMELLHGGDLFDRIITNSFLNETTCRKIMRRLLSAIHYLHIHQNICHRDIKPENIMCTSHSTNNVNVKLTDFGLAKMLKGAGTINGFETFCGTPQYFAPEVLGCKDNSSNTGGRYGKSADMWSLGVVLYVMLSGEPPFDASSSLENGMYGGSQVGGKNTRANIQFKSRNWGTVSEDAKDFVSGLLRMEPRRRLNIVEACEHKWILTEDGDGYLHPLDDPVLKLEGKTTKATFELTTTTSAVSTTSTDQRRSEKRDKEKKKLGKSEQQKRQREKVFQQGMVNVGNVVENNTSTTITTTAITDSSLSMPSFLAPSHLLPLSKGGDNHVDTFLSPIKKKKKMNSSDHHNKSNNNNDDDYSGVEHYTRATSLVSKSDDEVGGDETMDNNNNNTATANETITTAATTTPMSQYIRQRKNSMKNNDEENANIVAFPPPILFSPSSNANLPTPSLPSETDNINSNNNNKSKWTCHTDNAGRIGDNGSGSNSCGKVSLLSCVRHLSDENQVNRLSSLPSPSLPPPAAHADSSSGESSRPNVVAANKKNQIIQSPIMLTGGDNGCNEINDRDKLQGCTILNIGGLGPGPGATLEGKKKLNVRKKDNNKIVSDELIKGKQTTLSSWFKKK